MSDITIFISTILNCLTDFLASPPVFYLFIILCIIPILKLFFGFFKNYY